MSEIYHILNRGVDKRKIFLDKQDYLRFIHDLFVFNDQKIANSTFYSFGQFQNKNNDINNDIASRKLPRKLLVELYAFCLMPNHYHLLLSPKIENGISMFMKKVDMGYAKYFNQKYKRRGTLYESRYKSILVKGESHFYHLPYYIHFNPLDMDFPEWREGKLKNYDEAIKFLENYRWSSHLDYIGKNNFPSITQRNFLTEVFDGTEKYKQSIERWLKDLELSHIRDLMLE